MSLAITIVTTANQPRRFFQTDPARIEEILGSLRRGAQMFTASTLIIVADQSTELFSPRTITRLEIETGLDLTPYLPAAWDLNVRALSPLEVTAGDNIDDATIASRVDCFFEGGDSLAAWVDTRRAASPAERSQRIAHLFQQPVIPYQPCTAGIGLINPATLSRVQLGAPLSDAPAGTWYLNEA